MGWVHYSIVMPESEDMARLQEFLKTLGFVEDDWCAMNRADRAHVGWGPMSEPPHPAPWTLWSPELGVSDQEQDQQDHNGST